MDSNQFIIGLSNLSFINYTIKIFFVLISSNYIFMKIINIKNFKNILSITIIIVIAIISSILKYKINIYYSIITQVFCMSILNKCFSRTDMIYSISITIISLGISYITLALAIIISFIPNVIFKIKNDYINLIVLIMIYALIVYFISKIKKIKNGIIFLQEKLAYKYLSIVTINISMMILVIVLLNADERKINILITVVIFAIFMFLIIKKSLELYYKQTQLIKELKETKAELEESKAETKRLEEENLKYGKRSHTLAHRQRLLEYKINQLLESNKEKEITNIKTEVDKLSEQIYIKPIMMELTKTGISEIDEMLKYMQSECTKNKINFELQICGNIYYMINNLISKEELPVLIADHVKDAIIAINYSDNKNRSILVRLGSIDGEYSLYIYDSGIEFEDEVLDNLGNKPITTHADNGGTGMGFMNTFDTLRKHNASLIIKEIGKPSKDNYTKVIMIKFDGKNEFKVIS